MKTKKCLCGLIFAFLVVMVGCFSMPNISWTDALSVVYADEEIGGEVEEPSEPVEIKFKVDIIVVGQGEANVTEPSEDGFYAKETILTLECTPEKGWELSKIEGVQLDDNGYNSFVVDANYEISVVFVPKTFSFSDAEKGVKIDATGDVVSEEAILAVGLVEESDPRYTQLKNLLSNPDELKIYDISLSEDDSALGQFAGNVTMKIKLDEIFNSNRVKIFRVDVTTGEKVSYDFTYDEGGYVVFATDRLGVYTLSQTTGFKPASPSKDGTNKMALTLIIVGLAAVVAVVAVTVAVVVNKRKS